MGVVLLRNDPLLGGFYTVREAAKYLRIQHPTRIKSWLQGRSDGSFAPFIDRDYDPLEKVQELSFWDLIEVRFVNHFRAQGLSLQYLRKVASAARAELNHKHPFALSSVKFLTDRKKVFIQVAEADEDPSTRHVLGDQFEMYDMIEQVLASGVEFDHRTHVATILRPLLDYCPNVLMHPSYAYGHPVISDKHIPTSAIVRMFRAENGNVARVAKAFGVDPQHVTEAVKFEVKLVA